MLIETQTRSVKMIVTKSSEHLTNGSFVDNTTANNRKMNGNTDYHIRESPMGTKRNLKVIFMGAGCSGINFASQLQKRMENIDLTIYEKNLDFGGTWLENRYPGCACDIPSVSYQYTWARKPDWSQYYSGAREIHDYFKTVAIENNVDKFVKFNHKIIKAEWLD